jgi:type VI secretion system protein ImpH
MAPGSRTGADHLTHLAQLKKSPETHHIFVALRAIESAFPDAPRLGESRRPNQDRMRFAQEAELSFPPSTISYIEDGKNGKPPTLVSRFFGFFGPHGPLPLHLTEFARDRQRNHRDRTFVDFANMFTHRLFTLLYRAWRSGQPAPSFDRGSNDLIQGKVAAIAGYYGDKFVDQDDFPDIAKRYFAGLLAQGPKNAEGLIAILSAFFDAEFEIEEFVGSWLELEPDDRWSLGASGNLGQTTSIGTQVWTRGAKFRIKVGPLTMDQYRRLLPGMPSQRRMAAIVRAYVGMALDWDVNLILKAEEVPNAIMGESVQLGHIGWMGSDERTKNADELYLEADMMSERVSEPDLRAQV